MFFFKKKKKKHAPEAAPAPITGSVRVGERTWRVHEEKRSGPWPQLLILVAEDDGQSEMHVRPDPGNLARSLEQVADLGSDPLYRWFVCDDGTRWETRIVVPDPPNRLVIKYISWTTGVYECDFPYTKGLGVATDAQLADLLAAQRQAES